MHLLDVILHHSLLVTLKITCLKMYKKHPELFNNLDLYPIIEDVKEDLKHLFVVSMVWTTANLFIMLAEFCLEEQLTLNVFPLLVMH